MHVSIYRTDLHVCTCTMVFKAIFIINTAGSYGHVRMHVYALGIQKVNLRYLTIALSACKTHFGYTSQGFFDTSLFCGKYCVTKRIGSYI